MNDLTMRLLYDIQDDWTFGQRKIDSYFDISDDGIGEKQIGLKKKHMGLGFILHVV